MLLSNSNANWALVSVTTNALSTSRIINLGRKFSNPYLIIRVSTRTKKDNWIYGGKIWASALILGQQAKIYQADLDLFDQELLIVPQIFAGKYSLIYEAPKFFSDVTLKVWEYRGQERDLNLELLTNTNQLVNDHKRLLNKLADNQNQIIAAIKALEIQTKNKAMLAINQDNSVNIEGEFL